MLCVYREYVANKKTENIDFQEQLENAVIKYQLAVEAGGSFDIEDAYRSIIKLYNPNDFAQTWYEQYKYLFDSYDDFISDYMRVFIVVIMNWKPRNERKKSRYDGSGEFKNYFIGSLHHNYVNLVKSDKASKRNLTKMCPICMEWVNPMSTHVINHHADLLWNYLLEMNIDVQTLSSCPFCPNFKINKSNSADKIAQLIKNHFLSKHSSMLFHKFNELYPDVSTLSPKITTNNHYDDSNGELDIYDITEEKNGFMNKLYSLNLSDLQKTIIEKILNGDQIIYKSDKYSCSEEEWTNAMIGLRDVVSTCSYNE